MKTVRKKGGDFVHDDCLKKLGEDPDNLEKAAATDVEIDDVCGVCDELIRDNDDDTEVDDDEDEEE